MLTRFIPVVLALLLPLFADAAPPPVANTAPPREKEEHCNSRACKELGVTIINSLNQNTSACKDFYEYACSTSRNPTKEDALKELEIDLNREIERLLRGPKRPDEPISVHKAKDAFAACTNEAERNRRGNVELRHLVQSEFGGWPIVNRTGAGDHVERQWEITAGKMRKLGYSFLFRINVNLDQRNGQRHIIELDRARAEYGPGLSDQFLTYLGYVASQSNFMHDSAVLLGATPGEVIKEDLKEMLQFQMKLNKLINDDQQQVQKQSYDVMQIKQLNDMTEHSLDWTAILKTTFDFIREIGPEDEVLVLDVDYIKRLGKLIKDTDKRVLRNYMVWRVVKDFAEDGDKNMTALHPELRGHETQFKTDICIKEVKSFLGFAVTNMYVKHHDQQRQLAMVQNIVDFVKSSFERLIQNNTWMDSPTMAQALTKLRHMLPKTGYPTWIMDSKKLDTYYERVQNNLAKITGLNHFSNILSLSYLYSIQELELINTSSDRNSWVTSPLMANAFYHRIRNEIYIPVAILRRPFMDPDWPMAASFGGIGSVIGHEISHGFDDESVAVATNGSLVNWWTPATTPRYQSALSCVTQQYNKYCPNIQMDHGMSASDNSHKVCVDGQRTSRENVADIGGIKAAFHAYQQWKKMNTDPLPNALSMFSHDQVFFLNFAQMWCSSANASVVLKQLKTSSNSPNKYRLLGSLQNMHNFDDAFTCPSTPGVTTCHMW